MIPGKFISIEGIEGAGKSTALQFIKEYLTQANIDTVWTREPGGTKIGETLRDVLLSTKQHEEVTPTAELLMMFAARDQHMQHVILPALQAGKWVVSDRFIDASYAYQGGGRGLPMKEIKTLDQWIVAQTYPDLTLLLDISPEQGLRRAEKRGQVKDRIEQEAVDFFQRVRDVYLQRAQEHAERIKIIDASRALDEVKLQIFAILKDFIVRH